MIAPVKLSKKELAEQQEIALFQQREDSRRIRLYSPDTWKKIENWGRESGNLSQHLQNYCFTIAGRLRKGMKFEGFEISNGARVLDIVTELSPQLLEIAETQAITNEKQYPKLEVTPEVLKEAVLWDKKNKKLKTISYTFLAELSNGKKHLTDQNKKIASWNIEILQKCGFEYKPQMVEAEMAS